MRLTALLIYLLIVSKSAKAGIDNFTKIDKIDSWIIERRIDSKNQNISCRASIPSYYSWFGGRVRLNQKGDLILPDEYSKTDVPSEDLLDKVKAAIRKCEAGLIYQILQE